MCLWTKLSICQETMHRNVQQILQTSRCERRSVKCHFQPSLSVPTSHLESHINHLLFETDRNQKETHFRQPETSTDIMTEAESESGTLLNNQQLDLQKMHSSRLLWQSAGDMLFSCNCYCSDGDGSVLWSLSDQFWITNFHFILFLVLKLFIKNRTQARTHS